jgi:hypothetical protein
LSATGKVAPGDKKVPVMGITLAGGPINSKKTATSRVSRMRMTNMYQRDRIRPGLTKSTAHLSCDVWTDDRVCGCAKLVIDPYQRLTLF